MYMIRIGNELHIRLGFASCCCCHHTFCESRKKQLWRVQYSQKKEQAKENTLSRFHGYCQLWTWPNIILFESLEIWSLSFPEIYTWLNSSIAEFQTAKCSVGEFRILLLKKKTSQTMLLLFFSFFLLYPGFKKPVPSPWIFPRICRTFFSRAKMKYLIVSS